MITISLSLNIFPGGRGRVMVPGCEPSSALTSTTMEEQMRDQNLCSAVMVNVEDVLQAIPGSYIQLMDNMNVISGKRRLILPSCNIRCPCSPCTDWYAILRGLGEVVEGEELRQLLDDCSAFGFESGFNEREWR